MGTLKITSRDLYHIVIRSIITYCICIAVCIVFLQSMYNNYKERVNQNFKTEFQTVQEMTDEYLSERISVIQDSTEEFDRISLDNAVTYQRLLSSLCLTGRFDRAFYVEDGVVYTDMGEMPQNEYKDIWNRLQESGLSSPHIVQNIWETGDVLLMIPVSVAQIDGSEGYLIAFLDYTKIFDELFYHTMGKSVMYQVSGAGEVLALRTDSSLAIDEEISNDVFAQLMTLCTGDSMSKNKLQNAKVCLRQDQPQYVSFQAENGDECILLTRSVHTVDGIYLACVYDVKQNMTGVGSSLSMTALVLALLLLITMILVWFICYYLRKITRKIEKLAYTDEITKGMNTNYFRQAAMKYLELYHEIPYVIQRFDISNFRYFNEAYGHLRADDILKACTDIYTDIFSSRELCVRMDSDQFLALSINDSEVAERREKYCEAINQYALDNGMKYPVRFKFGVYQLRKQDHDIDVMIDRANVARRSIKPNDPECVAYYSDTIVRNMRKVDKLEAEMQNALDTGCFKVYLQAKWDILEDHVAGAEALVRWVKPDGTIIRPDEFIPVFERNGFIEKLDFYMLEAVCYRIREILRHGGTVYPVSVNQSRILLHNPEYLTRVRDILNKYDTPRQYIELEITETAFSDDRERMIDILKTLKKENVRLSMDDFGSGYSSLNLLKDMPFDALKIDREFFSESITSESSTMILQKIVEMATELGIEVICEGVENQNQVELLKKIGCRRVQGYYYAKPVPMEQYIENYCFENQTQEEIG